MEGENKKSGWKLWLYLTPVYILLAVPLVKWTMKINSSDVNLSKDEYGAFNSSKETVKKTGPDQYDPGLNDSGYSVRYRYGKTGGEQRLQVPGTGQGSGQGAGQAGRAAQQAQASGQAQAQNRQSDQQYGQRQANQKALESDQTKKEEQMSIGAQSGVMSSAIGNLMGSPRAVGALMNNSLVVKGFMGRASVQSTLGSPQGLQNLLSDTQRVNNFLNNSVVKAVLNNSALVNAFASSEMAKEIIGSPAVQSMLQNPDALNNLMATNPQAMQLMSNPNVLSALMNNPQTAGLAGSLGGAGAAQQHY